MKKKTFRKQQTQAIEPVVKKGPVAQKPVNQTMNSIDQSPNSLNPSKLDDQVSVATLPQNTNQQVELVSPRSVNLNDQVNNLPTTEPESARVL